jgi:hypothetical protein
MVVVLVLLIKVLVVLAPLRVQVLWHMKLIQRLSFDLQVLLHNKVYH